MVNNSNMQKYCRKNAYVSMSYHTLFVIRIVKKHEEFC